MSKIQAAYRRTFASLRGSRNFRLYLSGQFVSAVGTWMNFTASSWLILKLTHFNGIALGINSALAFGPILVLGAFGGVLADRFDKRRILVITQVSYAVVSLSLATIVLTGVAEIWMVYALSAVQGIVTAFDNPTRQSFYVEMVGEAALTNAVSLNSATFTGSRVIGPAMAGILIANLGTGICFAFDGLSYFAVLIALLAMRPGELHQQPRSTRDGGHLVAGLRYVWNTDELRRPLVVIAAMFTFVLQLQVLIPLLATRAFGAGAGEFGLLSAASGIGSFAGAVLIANRDRRPDMRWLAIYAIGVGAAMLGVAISPTVWAAWLLLIPVGFAAMSFMITANTMLQLAARPQARGRVMALYGVVFLGSTPIGGPLVGALGERVGPRIALASCASVAVVVGLAVLRTRFRRTTPAREEVEDVQRRSGEIVPA
jgi:MFS family permease